MLSWSLLSCLTRPLLACVTSHAAAGHTESPLGLSSPTAPTPAPLPQKGQVRAGTTTSPSRDSTPPTLPLPAAEVTSDTVDSGASP